MAHTSKRIHKNITWLLPTTLFNIGMAYHLVQPHMFSERSSQLLLLVASLGIVWFVIPRLMKSRQVIEKMSYVSLFVLTHLSYLHMSPAFVREASMFILINVVCFFIATLSHIRIQHTKT